MSVNNKEINIVSLNVASIRSLEKRVKLINFIKAVKFPPIICIQESNLNDHHNLRIPNYSVIRTDNKSRGTALLIKSNIQFEPVTINLLHFTITAAIILINNRSFLISSLYVPCDISSSDFKADFSILTTESRNYESFIAGGDLNAIHPEWDLNANRSNSNGKILYSCLNRYDNLIRISPNAPTRYDSNSVLDHFLVNFNLHSN